MVSVVRRNFRVTLPAPATVSAGISKATFRYSFDRRIFKQELRIMLSKEGIKQIPFFMLQKIEAFLFVVERELLHKVGQLLGKVIITGGYGFDLDRTGTQVIIRPTGRPAGLRTFNIRTGQLSHAYSFKIHKQRLIAQWGPVIAPLRPPLRGYPTPTQPSIPLSRSELSDYARKGEPAPGRDKIAAIEAGDPRFQRPSPIVFIGELSGTRSRYGMHPFEGAIQSNLDDLDQIYRAIIRDMLYRKAFITERGRRLRLPTFIKQVTSKQILDFIDTDLRANQKNRLIPQHRFARTFRGNSKLTRLFKSIASLVRKDSRFIKYADADILNKISDKYDKGIKVVGEAKIVFGRKAEKSIEQYLNRIFIDLDIE